MHRFLIVIEKAGKNFFLHIHRIFPGVLQRERRVRKQKERMHEAIEMHIRGLIEDGLPIPKSHSSATFVGVRAE